MKKIIFHILIFLLIFLFVYTALSKLLDYRAYVSDLRSQPFPFWMKYLLIPAIPIAELSTVILLCFESSRKKGLYLSLLLIFLFTVYTLLVLLKVFESAPCPCGGIIKYLSWGQHLIFNVCFLTIALLCLWLEKHSNIFMHEQG